MSSIVTAHRIFGTPSIHDKLIGLAMFYITAMKIIRHKLNRNHINIFRRLGIQGKTELLLIHLIRKIKMNNLSHGMNPTICSTSTVNSNGLPFVQSSQGFFNFFLNTTRMGLALKTSKGVTIIGNSCFISRHNFYFIKKIVCKQDSKTTIVWVQNSQKEKLRKPILSSLLK